MMPNFPFKVRAFPHSIPQLKARAEMSLAWLQDHPEVVITAHDLYDSGIGPQTYAAVKRWIEKGILPAPLPIPLKGCRWQAAEVLMHLGLTRNQLEGSREHRFPAREVNEPHSVVTKKGGREPGEGDEVAPTAYQGVVRLEDFTGGRL